MTRPGSIGLRRGEAAAAPVRVLADFATLTKPRITSFVWLAALVGALLAGGPGQGLGSAAEAALWVALVAGASSAFNQVLEREVDGRMRRTAGRPLPAGRLAPRDAVLFAALLATAGTCGLALRFTPLAALLALASLVAYTLVYTPLKRLSSFNTLVGAFPGAAPPLVGYAALAGELGPWAWALFATVFVWQFPHFFAIAWLHREDYRAAGMRMLPALPASEGLAGRQAFLYCLALLPVSLLPAVRGDAGLVYASAAVVLGALYLAAAAAFALRETPARARAVLVASLVYLPLVLSSVMLDPLVRLARSAAG